MDIPVDDLTRPLRVAPGQPADLLGREPRDRCGLASKDHGAERLAELVPVLEDLQSKLWAEKTRSVLLILQGMDSAGKDSTIKRVFAGLNPLGCRVVGFTRPHREELEHDYLWRIHANCPARGQIGIFNRSHYEDVVTVRVLDLVAEDRWRRRYEHIREFERMLVDEGTAIIKVFLHISHDEQRERLQQRIDDPTKHWKYDPADLDARANWDQFAAAYEEAITQTSTDWAPWWVVPADRKWARDVAVTQLLVGTLTSLDPQYPAPHPDMGGTVIP
jgi:PPK2 family polyphosphate:nucleotide phosphotransferase